MYDGGQHPFLHIIIVYQCTQENFIKYARKYCSSAENPYPNREVVTIKLNDRVQEESEGKKVLIETVFEMNYKTGMWRKLQYKRPHQ